MSSAIMIRNRNIAERFYGEYVENYRKIGSLTDKAAGELISSLQGLSVGMKKQCMEQVEELLSERDQGD